MEKNKGQACAMTYSKHVVAVYVNEPDVPSTISILRGLKEKYQAHHGVTVTDSALVAAATLSTRYISGRFQPDKSIDLYAMTPCSLLVY
jgi:ATP-dependent Clp protease ATP-binding subunit ClpA